MEQIKSATDNWIDVEQSTGVGKQTVLASFSEFWQVLASFNKF